MFKSEQMTKLFLKHRGAIRDLNEVGEVLRGRFHKMDDAVECMLIAALSGEAMVMIGPPGTAKSRLVRSFCHLLGLVDDDTMHQQHSSDRGGPRRAKKIAVREDYFEYLLTQFTEPSELFGFYDLSKLDKEGLVRKTDGMMQQAQVVFLDEVFNASSAILNSLLAFMNERRFHDCGDIWATPLQLLFAATNNPPRDPTLAAVYDRFLLRCRMDNIATAASEREEIVHLIQTGWSETHTAKFQRKKKWFNLLHRLESLRDDIDFWTENGELEIDADHQNFVALTQLIRSFVKLDLSEMSNRRLVKLTGLMLAMRLLRADSENADTVEMKLQDLDVVTRFSLDRADPSAVAKISQLIGLDTGTL